MAAGCSVQRGQQYAFGCPMPRTWKRFPAGSVPRQNAVHASLHCPDAVMHVAVYMHTCCVARALPHAQAVCLPALLLLLLSAIHTLFSTILTTWLASSCVKKLWYT
jgi:hypothetical protein